MLDEKDKNTRTILDLIDCNTTTTSNTVALNTPFVWDKKMTLLELGLQIFFFFSANMRWFNGSYGLIVRHGANSWNAYQRVIKTLAPSHKIINN